MERCGAGERRLVAEVEQDLADLRTRGSMKRAEAMAKETGENLATDLVPMYFTGQCTAKLVLIHLNPKLDDQRSDPAVPDLDTYLDRYARFGHYHWGSNPAYRSPFDHKQVRFLRPFNVISFADDESDAAKRKNAECAIDQKLQLELVPYASPEFRAHRFTSDLLAPHFQRILGVVTDHEREYILFCGAVFDKLLERSGLLLAREDHAFRLQKKDGSLTKHRYGFSNVLIRHGGEGVRAGIARSFATQGLPMAQYGAQCRALYDHSFE